MDISHIRNDYKKASLNENEVLAHPVDQFRLWLNEALDSQLYEPNAMTLSTISSNGRPAGRIVLLRSIADNGFTFFTNYNSRKGMELLEHPMASLTIFWPELERQVRIEGMVSKISAAESDTYFHSRPPGNRLGAWASPQSQVIPDRHFLEEEEKRFRSQFGDEIPRPPHWGGYRLLPDYLEFWQGRPSRLHDRIAYQLENDAWRIFRLAP